MNKKKAIGLFVVILLLTIVTMPATPAFAQGSGFTETFDEAELSGWEYSQDVSVEDGALKIFGGNFAIRFGDWSDITLDVRLRFTPSGEVVVNYYMGPTGTYSLIIPGEVLILEKNANGTNTVLAEAALTGFTPGEWGDLQVVVENGTHTISWNDTVIITVTDPEPLSSGSIQLLAFGEITAEFDSLTLTGTPGEGMPPEGGEPGPEGG
ncbi:MAG: DUF1080 domain-containing protein, partial [Chloroflexota bacterium]